MEVESQMSPNDLAFRLGYSKDSLPAVVFNRLRHRHGLTSWSTETCGRFILNDVNKADPDMLPLRLHSHQLAGVHSILRNTFTKDPTDEKRGMLIADEVGLGKTFQSITTLATLSDIRFRQMGNRPLPPLIGQSSNIIFIHCSNVVYSLVECPYLGTHNPLPNRPHLIMVPGTLASQWEHELKTLLVYKSYDILVYGVGRQQHAQFWAPDGPYHSSKHEPSQRIIIATHSVRIFIRLVVSLRLITIL